MRQQNIVRAHIVPNYHQQVDALVSSLCYYYHQRVNELGLDIRIRKVHSRAEGLGQQRRGSLLGQAGSFEIPAFRCL
jgi:hypothetical protein